MGEHIVCHRLRKRKLEELRRELKASSIDKVLCILIDCYYETKTSPKDNLIHGLNTNLDRYHYVLDDTDKELYAHFIALIRAGEIGKKKIVNSMVNLVENPKNKQEKLE